MRLYSTTTSSLETTFLRAAVQGLADDGGLWMPRTLPVLPQEFFRQLPSMDFPTMASVVMKALLGDEIPDADIDHLVRDAFDFDAPLAPVTDSIYALELFHGPTLAFKDFGARFMARAMSYALRHQRQALTIGAFSSISSLSMSSDVSTLPASKDLYVLVATSGDTGSAVAQGFWNVEGIRVVILYPKGKVSDVQEKQLTTMGGNITALEVQGTFDDCQALVKTAFQDADLTRRIALTSANSINIARLLPQSLYYFRAAALLAKHVSDKERERLIFCTPSGNFGNITGGLFAQRMGLPVKKFIAASNRNDTFPKYLRSGIYHAQASVETPSNAMDVGNPSNFVRILELYDGNLDAMRRDVVAYSIDDEETLQTVADVERQYGYVMCPHTAVAFAAVQHDRREEILQGNPSCPTVILSTAHPAKFGEVIEPVLQKPVSIPERLQEYIRKQKQSILLPNSYHNLKALLLS